jgi:universal stress protein A
MARFFKKILCPIDFDEASMAALDYACDLARDQDAAVHLLHVISGMVPLVSEQPARAELASLARQRVKGKVRHYEVLTRSGKPAEVINKLAEEYGVDLIVMATHGRTGAGRLLLGSVAEQVVRESARPVLTIRAAAASVSPSS